MHLPPPVSRDHRNGVEHKGLSLTLHVRTCPEHAATVEAWAAAGAERWGLRHGTAIANGMEVTKRLGNLPPNICTPAYVGEQARKIGRQWKDGRIF